MSDRAGDGERDRVPVLEIIRGPCSARAGTGSGCDGLVICGERAVPLGGSGRDV